MIKSLILSLFLFASSTLLFAHSKQDTLRVPNFWADSLLNYSYTFISDTVFYQQIVVDRYQSSVDSSRVQWIDSHAVLSSRKYKAVLNLATARNNSSTINSKWQDYFGYQNRMKMHIVYEGSVSSEYLGFGALSLYDLQNGYQYPLAGSYDGACSVPVVSPNGHYFFCYDYCPDCPDEESTVYLYKLNISRKASRIKCMAMIHFPGEEEQLNDSAEINEIFWGKDGNIYVKARKYMYVQAEHREDDLVGYICCAYYRIDIKQKSKPTE
ncbi:MAG: hypothetical protein RL138_1465 [Bacteroidota bacterium]